MQTSAHVSLLGLAVGLAVTAPAAGRQPSLAHQIAEAVAPLAEADRAEAAVLGYRTSGTLVEFRAGTNDYVCLADRPGDTSFQVSCYHKDLEPFMARGRELRNDGVETPELRRIRGEEIAAGRLPLPDRALLISLFGRRATPDAAPDSVTPLHVIYLPYATAAETGLLTAPGSGPWLMDEGQHRAHIMISGPKRPFTRETNASDAAAPNGSR